MLLNWSLRGNNDSCFRAWQRDAASFIYHGTFFHNNGHRLETARWTILLPWKTCKGFEKALSNAAYTAYYCLIQTCNKASCLSTKAVNKVRCSVVAPYLFCQPCSKLVYLFKTPSKGRLRGGETLLLPGAEPLTTSDPGPRELPRSSFLAVSTRSNTEFVLLAGDDNCDLLNAMVNSPLFC